MAGSREPNTKMVGFLIANSTRKQVGALDCLSTVTIFVTISVRIHATGGDRSYCNSLCHQ